MNVNSLKKWSAEHADTYEDLARTCVSVSALMVRLAILGDNWTRWDWALFIRLLCADVDSCGRFRDSDERRNSEILFDDMLDCLTSGLDLDRILTDKVVLTAFMLTMNGTAPASPVTDYAGFRLLAAVFAKFPALWEMNYMWTRHRNGVRTHKVLDLVNQIGSNWFECRGMDDFIMRFAKNNVKLRFLSQKCK